MFDDNKEIDNLQRASQRAAEYLTPDPQELDERLDRHEQRKAVDAEVKEIEQKAKCLNVITAAELYHKELPPKEIYLTPWLTEGASVMISAGTGVGKTWFANEIAKALTTGSSAFNNRWNAPMARKVLYIDGEMGERGLQERVQALDVENENLIYYYRERQSENEAAMNIADSNFTEKVLATVDSYKVDVVIIDNVFTLYQTGKSSNDAESWVIMQDFLLKLRDRGKAVILIDHNSKNQENQSPLGTSVKEFVLYNTIILKRPNGYREEEGAKFEVHFRKHRGLCGNDVKPFTVHLSNGSWLVSDDVTTTGGAVGAPQNTENYNKVYNAFMHGIDSPQKISDETGVPLRSVNRYLSEIKKGVADSTGYHEEFTDYG